ncbi:hypothetical protein ASG11_04205 [Sphingomonas sp. Leaf357]|uniref:hypothetical protein n=1 Tax=Sphingomonas sp. Leaf357 TaxID=1736350 RepID=UPI0006F5DB64|nr:hypothetical protein [Sphingomonas sp. Leaf357]KQS03554.1 hypothetical protein ASG11_04205 [Sphingomonas sp. Leaf357]
MVLRIVLAAGLTGNGAAPAAAEQAPRYHAYGPAPSWERYRAIAEAGIRDRMIDPESARITWMGGYFKGDHKPPLSPRYSGYVACGSVNAKNRMGGYTGASSFIVVIDYDRVLLLDIERTGRGFAGAACEQYALQQKLPPLTDAERDPASEATAGSGAPAAASARLTSTTSGLTLRAMPDGAYVSGVAAGSPAAIAGLTPGMVIGSVNAIPLGGMGDAMLKVVDAAGGTATLSIVGGKTLKLGGLK